MRIIGWLLGRSDLTSVGQFQRPAFDAAWAQGRVGLFWILLGATLLLAMSVVVYTLLQPRGNILPRILLAGARGLLLTLLLITLADPVLPTVTQVEKHPYLYVMFDGTDSMAIADDLPPGETADLANAVGLPHDSESVSTAKGRSRMEYVQALLSKEQDNLLNKLQDKQGVRIVPFIFEGAAGQELRQLNATVSGSERIDPKKIAEQLSTNGQLTALGAALTDARQQLGSDNLAGVVMFSDFAHNSGEGPLDLREGSKKTIAEMLGAPIYTVGLGATKAIDVAVDLQTDPRMKKAEKTNLLVKLRQTGLQGESVRVKVVARRLSGESSEGAAEILVGEKTVTLASPVDVVDFPYTPKEPGRFAFVAEAEPLTGEVVQDNNRAEREVNILDDYLRLMYVAHEPSWEWRFVKEVFHRDKLVGMQGFRTFLGSSDPRVRESNVLFLSTMTPKRSEFFANDVIFLGDMPKASLTPRFCEMVKEFVDNFGGGLVVIGGPRFGPKDLAGTPLADMLPVILDPDARLSDTEFRLKRTARASEYPFMKLGASDVENEKAWNNLGPLPWYQPVAQVHAQGVVLAEHPTDVCRDGKRHQPLIAVRQYGKGEVIYIAFDETWRLRRRYGEKYYREFWSQLIYRLGMSHALGSEKRFIARLDKPRYRVDEKVRLTIEAYDQNFEPLGEEKLAGRTVSAELTIPGKGDAAGSVRPLPIPLLRSGVFETQIPVYQDGEYTVRVKDPVSGKSQELRFDVTGASAERRNAVRDEQLQKNLALKTGGQSYTLTNVSKLVDDLPIPPTLKEESRDRRPLWSTPLWFMLLVGLMLGEWFARKLIRLS